MNNILCQADNGLDGHCLKPAVCIYGGEAVCHEHAQLKRSQYIRDKNIEYAQALADINYEFEKALNEGLPSEGEPTP